MGIVSSDSNKESVVSIVSSNKGIGAMIEEKTKSNVVIIFYGLH